jgi:hypothetical protein
LVCLSLSYTWVCVQTPIATHFLLNYTIYLDGLACYRAGPARLADRRAVPVRSEHLFSSREIYVSFGGLLMLPRRVLPLLLASSLIRDSLQYTQMGQRATGPVWHGLYEANTFSVLGRFMCQFGGLLMLPRRVLPLLLASSLIRDSFRC